MVAYQNETTKDYIIGGTTSRTRQVFEPQF